MVILSRSKLDTTKYDACVHDSPWCRVYAYSWYLDAFCEDWYVIMQGDYDAVMPVPVKRKWGISYVYKPPFTQQLGVFAKEAIDTESFYRKLKGRHLHIDYTHHGPQLPDNDEERPNYIVNFRNQPLQDQLNTNRKRDLKKAVKANLQFDPDVPWNIAGQYFTTHQLTDNQPLPAEAFHQVCHAEKLYGSFKLAAVREGADIIFLQAYATDRSRVYNLVPMAVHARARETGAATFALVELTRHMPATISILDFEGSAIEGVANFYRSLGGTLESYYHFHRSYVRRRRQVSEF